MNRIRPLRNPIREYDWGSRTALAELMGRPSPSAAPEAELWMGAHPAAPSEVWADAGWVSLRSWIERDPEAVLGTETARRFGGELPFLFKVLAPERALSIQSHPDAAQARAGFERENAAGIPLADPRRSFRDPNPKPELLCALTRFDALCGFRPPKQIIGGLEALRVAALEGPLAELRATPDRAGLERFFRGLLTQGSEGRRRLAEAVAEAAARSAREHADCARVVELARQAPGDVGVMAPLLLNPIRLDPGQALFLPAGELHSYLCGVGVELMANSDNVLRGGLTSKHVDVPELLASLTFRQGPPPLLGPRLLAPGEEIYETPAREFLLSVLHVEPARGYESRRRRSVEILLCTEGEVEVREEVGDEGLRLPRGGAVLVPAALPVYRLHGNGTVFRAGVPT